MPYVYTEEEKKNIIKRNQESAKANLKIVKTDFYSDLPNAVVDVLSSIRWRYINCDWFEEAWNKYREHVINATSEGKAPKAPGFVFNDYVSEQAKLDFLNEEMNIVYHSDRSLDELYHHGIKGQRWGVRRFQNEDGTLTEAGKLRYNPDGTVKDPAQMTDEELRKANQRMTAEQQFKQLTGTTQPDRALTKDNAIKIGATFVGTAALPVLYKAMKGDLKKTKKGQLLVASLLAGGIGALMATASSFGGEAKNIKVGND